MPTNYLRNRPKPAARPAAPSPAGRRVLIRAGRVGIEAELLDTPTAARVLAALPLHSTAETWGACVHFATPVETGRERGARINALPGEIYFWSEEDRVVIAFGETPISRTGEIRLPCACNLWARAIADVGALKAVRPGEKVSMTLLEGARGT